MEQHQLDGLVSLARKKAAIMRDLKKLPKDKRNAQQGYGYASAEGVFDTIRALMVEHGLVLFTSAVSGTQDHFTSAKGTAGLHTTVQYRMLWVDTDTGATVEDFWLSEGDDYQDKGYSKCATLALKYYLMTTFIVSSGDAEDDPDSGLKRRGQRAEQTPPKQAATSPKSNESGNQRVSTGKTAENVLDGLTEPSDAKWWTDSKIIAYIKENIGANPGLAAGKMQRRFDEFPTADDFIAAYRRFTEPVMNASAVTHDTTPQHFDDPLKGELLDITRVEPRIHKGRSQRFQWVGHATFERQPITVLIFKEDERFIREAGYDTSGWDSPDGRTYRDGGIAMTTIRTETGRQVAGVWHIGDQKIIETERGG